MKRNKLKNILPFFIMIIMVLTGCLKGNDINIPSTGTNFLQMEYIQSGGTTINSGLDYFSGAALTYASADLSDTATFTVFLAKALSKDLSVTLSADASAINDNYSNDSISYIKMPDSLYKFVSPTGTIKAGSNIATFQVVFYPSKFDITKSFILPVTITNTAGIAVSGNYGHIYFHAIGNPIAGAYLWDFYRYNNQAGTGSATTTWTNHATTFSPASPTSVKVITGYYNQPNYLISFKNTNGVLSNFTAVIDPSEITSYFTNNGISVVSGPTITVSSDYKTFTVNYVVFNGSAYRNLTDIYHK